MTTTRQEVLTALEAAISGYAWGDPVPVVQRNPADTAAIPAGGLIAVEDGDPGQPERMLGVPVWEWAHAVQVVAQVQHIDPAAREAGLDRLLRGVAASLYADPTLGGRIDDLETADIKTMTEPVLGGQPVRAALVTLVLHYDTITPMG